MSPMLVDPAKSGLFQLIGSFVALKSGRQNDINLEL